MTLQHCRGGIAAGAALAILFLMSGSAASAQPAPSPSRAASGPHISVELIAGTDQLRTGAQWLGVQFKLEPGWHLYWVNPGDGGGPPEATWTLPAGMRATAFEWPQPVRIETNGLVNYGYLGTLVLPVRLDMAADAPASPVAVRGLLRWLACKDMCVSGSGAVELRWPLANVDAAQVPRWSAAIADARARVPKPAPGSWTTTARSSQDEFTVEIRTGRREAAATFFPLETGQVEDSAPQAVTPLTDGIRLRLRKSAQLNKDPISLPGVVSFPDGRAFEVSVRVSR